MGSSKSINFVTVPVELQPIAYARLSDLIAMGYAPKCEHFEMDYPEVATIFVKDRREKRFYIFDARVKIDRVELWASYGRACSSSTFIALCLPKGVEVKVEVVAQLRGMGIGLTMIGAAQDIVDVVPAIDLSVNITLPPIARHPPKERPELAKIHALFGSGDWKRGFEDACKLVESRARDYLVRQIKLRGTTSPLIVVEDGKSKPLTSGKVKKMPLGALARTFCNLIAPKPIDSQLCNGLKGINDDRINVAHAKLDGRTERRLRTNVGRHMWTIDNLLRGIHA